MENILKELSASEFDRVYLVIRPFQISIRVGPLVTVEAGRLIRLSHSTGQELMAAGRVEPETLGELFEATSEFQTTVNGEFVMVGKGDILKLEKDEALALLRQGRVKEREAIDEIIL